MNENRDFKGIWIPKEVWLCEKLNAIDKIVYAEIDSLDNENHCYASNKYLADFCQVSESTITRSIKKLLDLNLIEIVSFNGRSRVIKVTMLPAQIDEADCSNCTSNNIDNNISTNIVRESIGEADDTYTKQSRSHKNVYRQNETLSDILGDSLPETPQEKRKRKSESKRYRQEDIDTAIIQFTDDIQLQEELRAYASVIRSEDFGVKRLKNGDQFRGYLKQLKECAKNPNDTKELFKIVEYSLLHSYLGFYKLDDRKNFGNDKYNRSSPEVKRQRLHGEEVIEELKRRAERNGVY